MRRENDPLSDGAVDRDEGHSTTRYVDDDAAPPSLSVVESVAEAIGTTPDRMRPLYEAVDPDALDRLFDPDANRPSLSADAQVSFLYEGCTVTVYGDGRTVVSVPDADRS